MSVHHSCPKRLTDSGLRPAIIIARKDEPTSDYAPGGSHDPRVAGELMIRELRVKVQNDGFRVDELILVTTMLDPEVDTKEELAELFLQRWNIELDLRSIKSVMQMDVLRCETPSMVEKEIWMHLLAYNLICTLMARGAAAHKKEPRQLSFQAAMQALGTFREPLQWTQGRRRARLWEVLLQVIAS